MRTAYVVKGHIDAEGTIVLDEPAPVPPGAVLVTIQTIEERHELSADYSSAERTELGERGDRRARRPPAAQRRPNGEGCQANALRVRG